MSPADVRAYYRSFPVNKTTKESFVLPAEIIDDLAIDAPKALDLFVVMIKGAHLHEDEKRRTQLASNSMESDKLVALLPLAVVTYVDIGIICYSHLTSPAWI
ncbi:hypothetical protein LXA43DRAFT_996366 [Ganoderma leucocontextum]|nr:hypothetical protein LXA43DRAFT_996340 [Ganoderma leucocontextum]KAI1794282.1 hypothetical protein LXA43DRAFT_996366 [Ganoderma leucocontextum]